MHCLSLYHPCCTDVGRNTRTRLTDRQVAARQYLGIFVDEVKRCRSRGNPVDPALSSRVARLRALLPIEEQLWPRRLEVQLIKQRERRLASSNRGESPQRLEALLISAAEIAADDDDDVFQVTTMKVEELEGEETAASSSRSRSARGSPSHQDDAANDSHDLSVSLSSSSSTSTSSSSSSSASTSSFLAATTATGDTASSIGSAGRVGDSSSSNSDINNVFKQRETALRKLGEYLSSI